jgi:hypothetical protein
MPNFHF